MYLLSGIKIKIENDKKVMFKYIDNFDDILTREKEFAQFTVSSWVVNKEKQKY